MNKFFKLFISAGTAITLIVTLAAVLAFATVYESQHGTPAVQQAVYKTWWFLGLLGVIFLNVLFASLSRLPYKKEHFGFHITHIGLLILLAGSMLTCLIGVEGQMALSEGETGGKIVTDTEQALFWREGDTKARVLERTFSAKLNRKAWVQKFSNDKNEEIVVSLDGFAANSRLKVSYEPSGESPNPMAEGVLFNENMKQPFWIALGADFMMGPAQVRFESVEDAARFQDLLKTSQEKTVQPGKGELTLSIPSKNITSAFPVEEILHKERKIPGTDLAVRVVQFYSHALVENNKLVNHSPDLINPAIEFEITGPIGTEKHAAFSLFPQFASLHGKTSRNYGVEARYTLDMPAPAGPNTLTIYRGPEDHFIYRATKKDGVKVGVLVPGETIETGWMDLKFKLKRFYPNAREKLEVLPLSGEPEGMNSVPALHATFRNLNNFTKSEVWVQKGSKAQLPLGEDRWNIHYGPKEVPLSFSVRLKDFILKNYPGSNRPMSYESFVEVNDGRGNKNFPAHIHMNHPLVYNGYKFFQASYAQNPGEPEVSVFSVKRDPGVPFIYGGSAILVAGILILFTGKSKDKVRERSKKKK